MTDGHSRTPADAVHRHIDAYNDGDADEFALCFDEQAVAARLNDGKHLAEGREEIREHWGELFQAIPEIHCEVIDQMMAGDFVVCRERVTGLEEPLEALAVYLVDDGTIQRLWLGE